MSQEPFHELVRSQFEVNLQDNLQLLTSKAETVIFPELTERYSHVPVILCATKCDDENNGDEGAAAAAMVAPKSGNGDLAVINEEDR